MQSLGHNYCKQKQVLRALRRSLRRPFQSLTWVLRNHAIPGQVLLTGSAQGTTPTSFVCQVWHADHVIGEGSIPWLLTLVY